MIRLSSYYILRSEYVWLAAISVHDGVYSTDFSSKVVKFEGKDPEEQSKQIEENVLEIIRKFSSDHMCKFLGAGVTLSLLKEVTIINNPNPVLTNALFRPPIYARASGLRPISSR